MVGPHPDLGEKKEKKISLWIVLIHLVKNYWLMHTVNLQE